jgi:ribosomal protein S18 acetylase RimI-like enzyme
VAALRRRVIATSSRSKILHVVDEFTRESLADLVEHSVDADATVACLDKIVGQRGRHPEFIRCDNGPELTANALPDWCRFAGCGASYIEPGSPGRTPGSQSYGSRMRDELPAIEQFDTLLEAQVLLADWRIEYNTHRPHSALCMLTPVEFADHWRQTNPPELSKRVDRSTAVRSPRPGTHAYVDDIARPTSRQSCQWLGLDPRGVPASPNQHELSDIVAFITAQQAHADRRISYVGTNAAEIVAELNGLEPSWAATARVLRDGTGITGAVITEWDDDLGRAWIIGPWVVGDGDAWMTAAVALLAAALAEVPLSATRYEMSGDVANHRLADLAASRGWRATEPIHVLIADAGVVAAWPVGAQGHSAVLRVAAPDDIGAITTLHDAEFPETYASAPQLVDGQLDGSRVVLVADDGHGGVAGYAAGEVHNDGEGFIDFVAVDPAARGTGVGRQLVVAVTRELLDRSPLGRVGLTVQHRRTPARTLYERLGFRSDGSLIAYRSWTT